MENGSSLGLEACREVYDSYFKRPHYQEATSWLFIGRGGVHFETS